MHLVSGFDQLCPLLGLKFIVPGEITDQYVRIDRDLHLRLPVSIASRICSSDTAG
jgi:hypothetical protein